MYQNGVKRMTDPTAAELLAAARKELGLTQAGLARLLGVSTVLISKLESGNRAPSEAFLRRLAEHLPERADAVRAAAEGTRRSRERTAGGLKIVDAMRLAAQNAERARCLTSRAEAIQEEANAAARLLDDRVEEFRGEVFGPATALLARISDLPDEALVPAGTGSSSALARQFEDAQRRTSRNVIALIDAGALGDGADRDDAATTTYLTVAGLAFASTGAAISGLAGSAASATLAAIGGSALSASGMGLAGATAALTGIVGAPVILAATSVVVASGGRILEKQRTEEQRIRHAEEAFGENEAVLRRFIARAGRITEILTVAVLAARNHRRILHDAAPGGRAIAWAALDTTGQTSVRRMLEIALAGMTVLSLPIGMSLRPGPSPTPPLDGAEPDPGLPLDQRLDDGSDPTNEFIDYAIGEAFSQIAR